MTVAGDVHLADLNEELRRRVLVISDERFHRLAQRVIVVPEIFVPLDDVLDPWRIRMLDGVFAVDLVRGLPISRLLERVDRAPADGLAAARRALRAIC